MSVARWAINILAIAWAVFEVWRTAREMGRHGELADAASSIVIVISFGVAGVLMLHFGREHTWPLGSDHVAEWTGLGVMLGGLALRAWSVSALGQFFTGTVMIRPGHRVVEAGPYAYLRHPSYTAIALGLLGYALTLDSAAALLSSAAGLVVGLGYRIYVEERALVSGLGDDYREYAKRTKRLIPFIF